MSIQYDLPMYDYLAMPALSSGVAFECVSRSPFHARHRQHTRALLGKKADVGTIAHQILLEGHEDNIVLVEANDWRTNAAKDERAKAYADNKTPLLKHDLDEIRRMVNAAREQIEQMPELRGILGTGHAEVTIDWEDNGITCKARPDYLTDNFYISLKTTEASCEPAGFTRRQLGPMGYDFSLAFYDRGLKANGKDVEPRILVIEQKPPFGASLIALSAAKRAIADAMVEAAIQTWRRCLDTSTFPSYASETFVADATPWELAEAEEREQKRMAGVTADRWDKTDAAAF